jgi:hypothetical protein
MYLPNVQRNVVESGRFAFPSECDLTLVSLLPTQIRSSPERRKCRGCAPIVERGARLRQRRAVYEAGATFIQPIPQMA